MEKLNKYPSDLFSLEKILATSWYTIAHVCRVVIIGSISFVCISGLSCFAGLVIYAYYSHLGCGPLESGAVTSSNQVQ